MKILVTGSKGQLGRCIQDVAKGYPEWQFVFTDYKELDITDSRAIENCFKEYKFDYCINCAAYTAVDLAESQVDKAYLINAEAVKTLAEACSANNSKLIHISTDFVFDGKKTMPYTEEDKPRPLGVYGASKLLGESYVQDILEEYFIVRTSWVYSEYGRNFMKTMLKLGNENKEISVVNDQVGSPTYAGDLATFILFLITNKREEYGLYHYSNEGTISWYDFAVQIFKQFGMKVNVNPIPSKDYLTPAKRPDRSDLNTLKVKKSFEFQIYKWEDSLKKCSINFKSTLNGHRENQ
ncbi:dTDP-4-dehydrorhamnose reductase [Flavobacteriaceae bacterium 3-367]|uniref:dTDP-4-dehydrorhamnose reductase n=1 Tax=Eudoraea algarum TaxID=3417568 RepID=UPI0032955B84